VIHSLRGSPYVSLRYTGRLAAASVMRTITVRAEAVIGLFKTEVIQRDGLCGGFEDVEMATLEWVARFNQERLLEPLGDVPPAEFGAQYCHAQVAHTTVGVLN
jgi:putative transposase